MCGITTDISNFFGHNNNLSGLQLLCKECHQAKHQSKEILAYNKWKFNDEKKNSMKNSMKIKDGFVSNSSSNCKVDWNEEYNKWQEDEWPKEDIKQDYDEIEHKAEKLLKKKKQDQDNEPIIFQSTPEENALDPIKTLESVLNERKTRIKEREERKIKIKEQKMILDEIEKEINKEKQDIKRIDDIASICPTGEKLQELKKELIDEE